MVALTMLRTSTSTCHSRSWKVMENTRRQVLENHLRCSVRVLFLVNGVILSLQCRKFTGSEQVRRKADYIYHRFKCFFLTWNGSEANQVDIVTDVLCLLSWVMNILLAATVMPSAGYVLTSFAFSVNKLLFFADVNLCQVWLSNETS